MSNNNTIKYKRVTYILGFVCDKVGTKDLLARPPLKISLKYHKNLSNIILNLKS